MPILVGRINGAYGVRGWLRVYSYMQPRSEILHYDWQIACNNVLKPFQLEKGRTHKGGQSILVKLVGLDSPEETLCYQNCSIYIDSVQLPALSAGEYYWHELIGKQVINNDGLIIGEVLDLMETGANDVLVVEDEGRYLIPFKRPEIVYKIDEMIHVHWQKDW